MVIALVILLSSFTVFAEEIELFNAIPGAVLYEVQLKPQSTGKILVLKLDTPNLDTNRVEAGDYVMKARFLNVRRKWSEWTESASLKIVKKIRTSTRNIFEDKFPFGVSAGFSSLQTKLTSGQHSFKSTESVIRTRGFIQRGPFKINVEYDNSQNFTRFNAAILKRFDSYSSFGINFWMVNFDGRNTSDSTTGLINYTQAFIEYDFMYPFLDRWYVGTKLGLGLGLSYYARPELTYSIPFGDEFFISATALYEMAKVKQSNFEFDANGAGVLVNLTYFLELK